MPTSRPPSNSLCSRTSPIRTDHRGFGHYNLHLTGATATELGVFAIFPVEVRLRIFSYIALSDRIVVTPNQIRRFKRHLGGRNLHFISHFMLAFSSVATFPEYLDALWTSIKEDKQAVKVAIVDYNFANFKSVTSYLQKKDGGKEVDRFFFAQDPAQPVLYANLSGPCFCVELYFTHAFNLNNEMQLLSYFFRMKDFQEAYDGKHFRAFYTVAEVQLSVGFSNMLSRLGLDDTFQGQRKFLMNALQKNFAYDLDALAAGLHPKGWGANDLNLCYVRNDQELQYRTDVDTAERLRALIAEIPLYGQPAPFIPLPPYAGVGAERDAAVVKVENELGAPTAAVQNVAADGTAIKVEDDANGEIMDYGEGSGETEEEDGFEEGDESEDNIKDEE